MLPSLRELGIDNLSIEDRLKLIGEIWDSITPIDQMEIPESHRKELDRRIVAADAEPSAGKPWAEVRARLRREILTALMFETSNRVTPSPPNPLSPGERGQKLTPPLPRGEGVGGEGECVIPQRATYRSRKPRATVQNP